MDNEKRDWAQVGLGVLLLVCFGVLGFLWTRENKSVLRVSPDKEVTEKADIVVEDGDATGTTTRKYNIVEDARVQEISATSTKRLPTVTPAINKVADCLTLENMTLIIGTTNELTAKEIINITNNVRNECGVGNLKENATLTKAAELKLKNMIEEGYWNHTSPSGKTHNTFIDEARYVGNPTAENLAIGFDSPLKTVFAWFKSPTHRANLLGRDQYGYPQDFNEIGVAISDQVLTLKDPSGKEVSGRVVVQLFGKR